MVAATESSSRQSTQMIRQLSNTLGRTVGSTEIKKKQIYIMKLMTQPLIHMAIPSVAITLKAPKLIPPGRLLNMA